MERSLIGLPGLAIACAAVCLAAIPVCLSDASGAGHAAIHGRVVDSGGRPVVDAVVVVSSRSGRPLGETTSDEDGAFRIDDLLESDRATRLSVVRVGFFPFETSIERFAAGEAVIVLDLAPFRERVSVTAGRREKRQFETSEAVSVVTASDMRALVAMSAPAAIEGVTGLQMQRTSLGGGSPFLRGLIGNRILLLVDGIRVNNSTCRLGPNQYLNTVDPFGIERVEIVRGPASSLYGSDGLGGVINLFSTEPGSHSGGVLAVGFDSSTSAPLASLRLGGVRGPFSMTGSISAADFDDLEGGKDTGTLSPTGYRLRTGDVKMRYRGAAGNRVTIAGQYLRASDVPRYDRLAAGKDDLHVFDPQRRTLSFGRWERDGRSHTSPDLAITLSRMVQLEGRRVRRRDATIETMERDEVVTDGISAQLTWPRVNRLEWVAGVELYRDGVSTSRVERDLVDGELQTRRPRLPDGSRFSSFAVYGQAGFPVGRSLELSLGLRYSVFDTEAWLEEPWERYSSRLDDLNASVAFLLPLSESVHLTGGIARGFRAPSLDDATVLGVFNAGVEVPNPNLSPEKVLNYELGLKISRPRGWFAVTIFDSKLKDLIGRAPGTYRGSPTYLGEDVYQRQNLERAEITGFELEFMARPLERMTLSASLAGVRGTDEFTGEPLRRIPPLGGRLSARWLMRSSRRWIDVIADFASRQDRLSPLDMDDTRIPEGGTPGYVVLGACAGLGNPDGWQMNLVLHNVTDETYRVHGSGIDGPGRSLRILISRRFRWEGQ